MPEARQNSSKLAEMFDRASSFNALVGMAVDVVSLFMALLSSVESAPRAYRLKASNAASPFSTSIGTIPQIGASSSTCHSFALTQLPIDKAPRSCFVLGLVSQGNAANKFGKQRRP